MGLITISDILNGRLESMVPETPELLGIQKETYREGQQETIQGILDSPAKYIMVIAPTGRGKSVIGVGTALMLARRNIRTAIVTKTIQLQAQYLADFDMLGKMLGRSNYHCVEGHANAADAPCAEGGECRYKSNPFCDYYSARMTAADLKSLVINYDLWASSWLGGFNKSSPLYDRPVYICDEAHLLDESVRSAGSVSISGWMKDRIFQTTKIRPPNTLDHSDWVIWAVDTFTYLSSVVLPIPTDPEQFRGKKHLIQAWKLVKRLTTLISSGDAVVAKPYSGGVTFEPVFAGKSFREMTAGLSKVVMMSATLPAPALTARLLGIHPSEIDIIELDSTFPAYRRPLIYDPAVRVTRSKMTDADLDTLVEKVDEWLERWSDRKGIIHAHAFWLQDAVLSRTKYRSRILTHEARGLPAILETFRVSPQGTFLISPSAHSGVDLPGDLIRGQIILKVPMPDLRDPVIAARKEEIPATYDLSTAATLVQQYGRGMRSEDDWCETVCTDANLGWWFKRNKEMFPRWVRDAMVWHGE